MIYTSYFGNLNKLQQLDTQIVPVSIAGKTPDWFTGKKYRKLAPQYEWWKEWHDKYADNIKNGKDFYIQKYNDTVLNAFDPKQIADELKLLADGNDVCLLCYETPEKFCHRHLVANWFQSAGILCAEWNQRCSKHNWSLADKELKICKNFIEQVQKFDIYSISPNGRYVSTEEQIEELKDKAWKTLASIQH